MTHRERILTTLEGRTPDRLAYTPRLDLWYNANAPAGTLPARHAGRSQDEISRAEGWALHKVAPDFLSPGRPEDVLHRALGLYNLREMVFSFHLPADVAVEVAREGDRTRITYRTPRGAIRTATTFSEEMRKSGNSLAWISEPALKGPEDYSALGYIFENIELRPAFQRFGAWQEEIGPDGVACAMAGLAASPMHHIQREFLDATQFYYHYNDHKKEMRALAESLEPYYEQALKLVLDSPAEVILWGANYDDMITYPAYFEKEILPWLQRASAEMAGRGKRMLCHCDGENQGLLDLIAASGIQAAEAVCPWPMTKVPLEEYYRRWGERLTVWGGLPSNLLLAESADEAEFDAFVDHLFRAVAPGNRFIVSIADCVPPGAVFDRLVRLGERVEKEGRLPLEAGAFRPLPGPGPEARPAGRPGPARPLEEAFGQVHEDVLLGREKEIRQNVARLLEQGFEAADILRQGMLSAMEVIGQRFVSGDVFIPEVLLSARALNGALELLEPHLAARADRGGGRIMIGTVFGDVHDIGKNIVITMLKGVGFEVIDLGINVPAERFVREVAARRPKVLGLSALLTTTMPQMRTVIEALDEAGLRSQVKIMVGGAPVNDKFARQIGADGYAPNAGQAVALARRLSAD